jgi:hypothetical protein
MTFEEQIKKLCEEVVACESEKKAIELAREMRGFMHKRIEELREHLITLPPLGPTNIGERSG